MKKTNLDIAKRRWECVSDGQTLLKAAEDTLLIQDSEDRKRCRAEDFLRQIGIEISMNRDEINICLDLYSSFPGELVEEEYEKRTGEGVIVFPGSEEELKKDIYQIFAKIIIRARKFCNGEPKYV